MKCFLMLLLAGSILGCESARPVAPRESAVYDPTLWQLPDSVVCQHTRRVPGTPPDPRCRPPVLPR